MHSKQCRKYISFSIEQLKFLDSFQFMPSSLAKLVENTPDLKLTRETFGIYIELLRKGVYPYEYVDTYDNIDETQLPPKDRFYSSLNDEHISDKDYEHAQNVWKQFNCKTLGNYNDLYLKTDVTLLADVFQRLNRL